jgi:hypothetical protein
MSEFESIERLVQEFGEENKSLIENKLGEILYKIDELKLQNLNHLNKTNDLEKRVYAVESHPYQCSLAPRLLKIENEIKNYGEYEIPKRLLIVEKSLLASASIKKWLIAAIGITTTLFSLIIGILKLIGWI